MRVIIINNVKITRLLLFKSINIKVKNMKDYTLLYYIIINNYSLIIKLHLKYKSDLEVKNNKN